MWVEARQSIRPLKPNILHPMQTDPRYALSTNHNGSWLGAVDTPNGDILLLGALGLDAHVNLDGQTLQGWYEVGGGQWFVGLGPEKEIFAHYTALLGIRLGVSHAAKPPRAWCSWYSLYTAIYEDQLLNILDNLGNLPFDVFQIDDGWQRGIGDWEPNHKFPSGMALLAERIRASGRTPGLWLAPLLVVPSSSLFHQHGEWLLHDERGKLISAGFNWGEPLYALDTTHPEALDWLALLMKKVRAWGYKYLKLDFLYAGALPGIRHNSMPREAALRHGMKVIRKALGRSYLLTCGVPILPALGLCDGMRIGPDVAGHWDNFRDSRLLNNLAMPGVRNAIRTSLNRLWLRPLVHIDPDVVYFRTRDCGLTTQQKQGLQDLASIAGFKATSDPPMWLSKGERDRLAQFLERQSKIEKMGRYNFQIDDRSVDFAPAARTPEPLNLPLRALSPLAGWVANLPLTLKLNELLAKHLITWATRDTRKVK
jgi:alpha-galactosidase